MGLHRDMLAPLVRRGVDVAQAHFDQQLKNGNDELISQIPAWALIIIGLTAAGCVLLLTSVRYTLYGVVSTLAMIEEPTTTYLIKEEKSRRGTDAPAEEETVDSEVLVIKQKPITSNIRSTIKHLQARAGFAARWRGLSLFVIYAMVHGFAGKAVARLIAMHMGHNFATHFLSTTVGSLIASIALARYSTAWVHIVISEPSTKPWFRRVPSLKVWKQVWAPTAIVDLTTRLAFVLPTVCFLLLGLHRADVETEKPGLILMKLAICVAMSILTLVSLVIPACVTLVRVQASLLPEEDESIVPFDRTYGGKVIPEILGGSGAIGFMDAWKTFDLAARARIVKLFFKFIMVEISLHIGFFALLALEALVFIGPEKIHSFIAERLL